MRILVTGGAGYIGSQTVKELLAKGYEPVTLDNLSEGHREAIPGGAFREGDIADGAFVRRVLRDDAIEAVFHFAASCLVGESVTDPAKYYRDNLLNSITLLDAMRDTGVAKMIFSSTCATYGDPIELPMTEAHPQVPVNPYGESKLAFERVLRDYAAAYGMRAVSLRYFNAAGADASGHRGEDHHPETHLIPIVFAAALGTRERVDVFGDDYATPDGSCVRDYIHIVDLAHAHILALERMTGSKPFTAYNLGTGRGYSVLEVIRAAEEVTKRSIPFRVTARRAGDPAVLIAGAEKVQRELGWTPSHSSIEEILVTSWAWHLSHPRGYGGHA